MAAGDDYSFSGEDHQDVMINILSRLSTKSLLRFKCVCKSWYSLIKTSYFISKHLQQSHETLSTVDAEEAPLFAICNGEGIGWTVSWITSTFKSYNPETTPFPDSLLPCCEGKLVPKTIGPINGIYCWIFKINFKGDNLVLCNPGLREVKAIPKLTRCPVVSADEELGSYFLEETYGFGYDPIANDYKVVAVTRASYVARYDLQIFVYSLSSNSWRKLQIDIDDNMQAFPKPTNPVLTNGNRVCHWLASDKEQRRQVILSFDFGSEAFKSSPLPRGLEGDWRKNGKRLYLSVLNESSSNIILVAVGNGWARHKFKIKTGCCYDIFMMNNEDGGSSTGKEVWTMLYSLGSLPGVSRPLGFRKNGEIILAKFDGSLVTYDPSRRQQKHFHNCPQWFEGYQVCTYMESLVSIHGGPALKRKREKRDRRRLMKNQNW